jgi:hypothetical protein
MSNKKNGAQEKTSRHRGGKLAITGINRKKGNF